MAEFNVTYNINSDEMIRNVDDTFRRITEMSRNNSAEQIRLMNEQYSSMTSILDSYMDRVRIQFSTYIDIAKNAWTLASSDSKDYFDDTIKKLEEMLSASKMSYEKQTEYSKEATKKRLEDLKNENETAEKTTKERIDRIGDMYRNMLYKGGDAVDSGIGSVKEMGGLGGTSTGKLLDMGGNLIGGGVNILSGLNAGQGIKDIAEVMQDGIGMLIGSVKQVDDFKRQIMLSYGGRGIDEESIYGGQLTFQDPTSLMRRLQTTATKFAGTPEMQEGAQLQLNQQYQGSRTFGDTDYHQLGTETALIGRSRNMASSEVANLFIDIKQKLNEPLENLTGRFFQLDNISKDLGISIRDVIKDYQSLMRDNQKYGYTQEQVMGLYTEFGDEIKKGTVSVSQLSEYMKGLAGIGTDQSVGVAALLKDDQAGTMSKFTGDKENAQQIFDLLNKANDTDAGLILKMINSPKADYSQDPFLAGIMDKYNLTSDILQKLKPDVGKLVQAKSISQAGDEGLGTARIIEEKMMQLMGLPLNQNFFDSMQQQKGLSSVGTTKGVMSLGDATRQGENVVNTESKNLQDISNWIDQLNKTIENNLGKISMNVEETWKLNKGENDRFAKVATTLIESSKQAGHEIVSMFENEKWTEGYDKFANSTDKFDSAVDKFSNTYEDVSSVLDSLSSFEKFFGGLEKESAKQGDDVSEFMFKLLKNISK